MRRDEGIPPYGRPGGRSRSGWPEMQKMFVGAGFTAPAGAFRRPTAAQRRLLGRRSRPRDLAATRGSRDDASIVPYRGLRLPVGRAFAAVRRGGPWPSRGPCGGAGCGGMRASRPTTARAAAAVPVGPRRKNVRRGGIYPARGTLRRRKPGRYGIGPYRGLRFRRGCAFPVGRRPPPKTQFLIPHS